MQMPDGSMQFLDAEQASIVRRLFDAGGLTAPVFAVGEEIEIRNARFRVVALDNKLLVLEGVPARTPKPDPERSRFEARVQEMEAAIRRLRSTEGNHGAAR